MAKQRIDPAVARAHAMMDWLASLNLPTRASNALRRDLEVTLGIRAGKAGSGTLATMDQAQFVAELYRANGGKIRTIPGVADTAISALRAVIPPPAGMPDPTAADFTLPPLDDDEFAPAPAAVAPPAPREAPAAAPRLLDDDAALHPAVHFGADPEDEDHADELAELARLDAAPTTVTTQPRRVPRRRGRPRRSPAPAPPANGNGAAVSATVTPEPLRIDTIEPLPAREVVVISEEQRLLQLWSALHPQGRRATLGFIATLVAEEV
jgi:hypothetical protein